MTLTEQWKKGELPSRDDEHEWLSYYIKHNDGYIHADSYWRGKWGTADRNSIAEILAPVPTYQEYLESESHCAVYSDINKWLKDESSKIRDLLKECKEYLSDVDTYCTKNADESYLLITRINTVIGESEE